MYVFLSKPNEKKKNDRGLKTKTYFVVLGLYMTFFFNQNFKNQ